MKSSKLLFTILLSLGISLSTVSTLKGQAALSEENILMSREDSVKEDSIKESSKIYPDSEEETVLRIIQDLEEGIEQGLEENTTEQTGESASGSPLFIAFALLWFCVFLLVVFVGLIACALVVGLLIILTIAGVIGTSVLVGLYKRSLSKGFSTFVVLAASVFGAGMTGMIAAVRNYFFERVELYDNLDAYMAMGAIAGIGLGFIVLKLLNKVFAFLQKKYKQIRW